MSVVLSPCPQCDDAAVTDEHGCCIHCGAPRCEDDPWMSALLGRWFVAWALSLPGRYGVLAAERARAIVDGRAA